jgi:hypothetical protein
MYYSLGCFAHLGMFCHFLLNRIDPHHCGKQDPEQHDRVESRIWIRIKPKSRNQIRIKVKSCIWVQHQSAADSQY